MSDQLPTAAPDPYPEERRRRGFARFLFRTPLGIVLLLLVVLFVCVALAPTIAEKYGAGYASNWFSEHYHGRLKIKKLDLGWGGTQTVEEAELQDPDGARIAVVSATLPGLWSLATSGGTRLGKIKLVGEADLHADAAGHTNLERALEPRQAPSEDGEKAPSEDSSSRDTLSKLDAEIEILITRVTWADEHTRELGAPFVLEDVSLVAVLKPDQAMTAKMRGTLTGSVRSDLSLDARIEHAFEAPSSRTPPKAEVAAQIAHFPTALVDALAQQGGRLNSLLGEELSLQLAANGTVQQGSFDLRLDTPRATLRSVARMDNGMLRSEGEGVAAEFDLAPEFLDGVTGAMLPEGARLERVTKTSAPALATDDARVRLELKSFEVPLGPYLEDAAKGRAEAALDALLAGTRANLSASLGDWWFMEAGSARGPLVVRALVVSGELKAPAEESSLKLSFQAAQASPADGDVRKLGATQPKLNYGQAQLSLTFAGGATLARFTPSTALQPIHAIARVQDVPTALVDSIAGVKGDLTRALGPALAVDFDWTASIEAATNPDFTWADVSSRWRELARRATSDLTFNLRGSPRGESVKALGDQQLSVHTLGARASFAPSKPIDVHAQAEFETPAAGHFDLDASLGELFADPASKTPLRFSLASKASGLPTRVADALAGQGERVQQLLGNLLAFDVTAQGTLDEGVARVNLSSEKSQLLLVGRLKDGMFVSENEAVLSVSLQPDARLLDEFVAPHMPKGSRLAFVESRGVIGVNVNFLTLPVADLIEASKKSTADALSMALARTRIEAIVGLREFVYEDETLIAAGQRIDKLAVQLNIETRPGEKTTPLTLDLALVSPSWGDKPVEVHLDVPHAPQLLEITNGAAFAPIVMKLRAAEMQTALLDAYAGGALQSALGPKLDLALDTTIAQVDGAPFSADAKLELAAAGGKSTLAFQAHAKDPFDRQGKESSKPRPAGTLPELDATLDVSGAGSLLAFAPENVREMLRELCGEKIAASVKLAEGKPGASKAELSLDAGGLSAKGAVDYTDRTLSTIDAQPLVLKVAPSQATLERLLAGKLPQGASLTLNRPGSALVVQLTQLRAPLGAFFDAEPAARNSLLIESLDLKLDAAVPAFTYTHPPGAEGAAAAVVALRDVQLHARMQPGAAANLDMTGSVGAEQGGLELHAIVEKPAGFAVAAPATFPAPGSRAKLTAKLSHFPSALLDVLAAQDGLLVDVLGPELDANLRGEYPDSKTEPLHAEMHSTLGDVALDSRLVDGKIVSDEKQGLDAKVGLTPLFSKRIVGSLVPMLVEVRQDDPTKRTLLTGRKLSLPMDADLSKLSGDLILDLGAVDYQLLPGLTQALSLSGKEFGAKNTVIKPITIKIVNGVARYDSIPIKISGREINFHGSTNLATKTFELGFAVPLEMLGSKVESQLESVRRYLDPKLEVPLEISGTWSSPKIRLGKGFLEKVLKDAATGALQGELEKGLGGLLGGGKKKKDG